MVYAYVWELLIDIEMKIKIKLIVTFKWVDWSEQQTWHETIALRETLKPWEAIQVVFLLLGQAMPSN